MPEQSAVRLAIIGCGGFSSGTALPSLKYTTGIQMAAACDLDEAKAKRWASHFGNIPTYTDMDKMLDEVKPEGVFVIGPGPMQYEVGLHVLSRGFPIHTEKPSANTSHECLQMAAMARDNGVFGSVGFMKRSSAAYLAAKSLIDKQEFGPVRMFEVRFTQGPYPSIWGVDDPMRVSLIGQFVHICDLTRFLAGDIDRVFAKLYRHPGSRELGCFAATLTFKSGGLGVMDLNCLESNAWHFDEMARVCGFEHWLEVHNMNKLVYHPVKGWIEGDLGADPRLKNQTCVWEPALWLSQRMLPGCGYVGELQNFADCVRTKGKVKLVADLDDCAAALKLGEAIWESTQSGKEVAVG